METKMEGSISCKTGLKILSMSQLRLLNWIIVIVVSILLNVAPVITAQIQHPKRTSVLSFSSSIPPDFPPLRLSTTKSIENPTPQFGDQRLLFILTDFPDQPGLFPGLAWHNLFFNSQYSFAAYYREVSYGKLRYSGDFVGIRNGALVTDCPNIAYVRLDHPITYYADGQAGFSDIYPKNVEGVVYDALQKLDDAGFDFSPYGIPGRNIANNVFIIYGGSDNAYTANYNNSLLSASSQISYTRGTPFVSKNGYIIDDYTLGSDQAGNYTGKIGNIGVAASTQGFALGMNPLYDYSYTTAGVGYYDSMAYGYFGFSDGAKPFHFGAFSKEFYGWVEPTIPPLGTTRYTLAPVEKTPQIIKLFPHGNTSSKDYFLIENRQPIGFDQDWSKGLCPGIFIWYIDRNITENYDGVNSPPDFGGGPHHGVVIVEADGRYDMLRNRRNRGECSDRWRVGRTWNDTSTPNSKLWNKESSGISVSIVNQTGYNIDIIVTVTENPTHQCGQYSPTHLSPANGFRTLSRSVTLTWTVSSCAPWNSYNQVWIRKGNKQGRLVDSASNLMSPLYTTMLLGYGSTYYWQAATCSKENGCNYSPWKYFKIG